MTIPSPSPTHTAHIEIDERIDTSTTDVKNTVIDNSNHLAALLANGTKAILDSINATDVRIETAIANELTNITTTLANDVTILLAKVGPRGWGRWERGVVITPRGQLGH